MRFSLWQEFWIEVAAHCMRPQIATVYPIFWQITASNGRELFAAERTHR